MKQYVYVMSCPSLPHLVKIGFSKDCEERTDGLNTSTPTPFKVEKEWEVDNARHLEKTIHRILSLNRISPDREFFGISIQNAIKTIDAIISTGIYENEKFDEHSSRKVNNCSSIGKLIKYERERQGITQKQLALTCGTGLRVIGEIEKGKDTAQIGIVLKILTLLRIDMFCVTK